MTRQRPGIVPPSVGGVIVWAVYLLIGALICVLGAGVVIQAWDAVNRAVASL